MRRATERLRNAGISLSGKCHYCFEPTPNHTRNCPTCKGPTMADARERATEAFLKAGGWDDVADGRDCDSGFDEAVEIIEQALLAYATELERLLAEADEYGTHIDREGEFQFCGGVIKTTADLARVMDEMVARHRARSSSPKP